jgi:hypothetical protein
VRRKPALSLSDPQNLVVLARGKHIETFYEQQRAVALQVPRLGQKHVTADEFTHAHRHPRPVFLLSPTTKLSRAPLVLEPACVVGHGLLRGGVELFQQVAQVGRRERAQARPLLGDARDRNVGQAHPRSWGRCKRSSLGALPALPALPAP